MSRPERLSYRLWQAGNDSQECFYEVLRIDSMNDAAACHERDTRWLRRGKL